MPAQTTITSDDNLPKGAAGDGRNTSADRSDIAEDVSTHVIPPASDISGRVALVMASSALAVAIFLIFLVAKAASNA